MYILDESPSFCDTCPNDGIIGAFPRTEDAFLAYRDWKINRLRLYSCVHKVTNRPVCAIPCDGIHELCENNSDEECQGPGLIVTWGTLLIFSGAFISFSSITVYHRYKKEHTQTYYSLELRRVLGSLNSFREHIESSGDFPYLKISLYICTMDIRNGMKFATDFYKKTFPCPCSEHDYHIMQVLGTNEISAYLYDCIDGSFLVKVRLWIFTRFHGLLEQMKKCYVGAILIVSKSTVSLCLRYSDMSKDLLFLYMIWLQLGQYEPGSFPMIVFYSLAASLIATEIGNICIIFSSEDVVRLPWKKKVLISTSAPLMPAYYIYEVLFHELTKCFMFNTFDEAGNRPYLEMMSEQLIVRDKMIWAHQLKLAKLQYNENVLENIPQLTILFLITLLNNTSSRTVVNLQNVFIDERSYIGWVLATVSSVSLIRGQINLLVAHKNGCQTGTFYLIAYFVLGMSSRKVFNALYLS